VPKHSVHCTKQTTELKWWTPCDTQLLHGVANSCGRIRMSHTMLVISKSHSKLPRYECATLPPVKLHFRNDLFTGRERDFGFL